jgi:hypothetical protein
MVNGVSFSLSTTVTLLLALKFATHFPCVDAIDLKACGDRLQEQQGATWNATHPTEPPPPFSLTYEQCLMECGAGVGGVNWQGLSQNFGAWLLPWITLMFQIPFGAERKFRLFYSYFYVVLNKVLWRTDPLDDVLAFFITIGSPALAAYSLQITHLNKRWITAAFLDVRYPNSKAISAVLSAFHHVPIQISDNPPFLHSLIVLPQNDDFWRRLLAAANKTRRWSIPLIMNFVLLIFAVILTAVDSFYPPLYGDIGYAITTTWVFLLPLIIGWLHVGCEPEPNHLRNSLESADLKAWVATNERDQPAEAPLTIDFVKAGDVDPARRDELRTVPLFNYARAFISPLTAERVLEFAKNAAANAEQRIPVGNSTGGVPTWVVDERGAITNANRIGTSAEVIEYCTRILPRVNANSSSTTPLDIRSSGVTDTPPPLLPLHNPRPVTRNPSRWATGIWKRVALATILALGLQWGTVGGEVIIHYMAPPAGLGCRAVSFLLYAAAGTASFFLLLASSILAHMSRPHPGRTCARPWLRTCQDTGAIIFRWLGKCIAILSGMGILVVCFFQITGAFDNCFCTSTTFDKGRHSVVFQVISYVIGSSILRIWIGALVMAGSTATLFGFSMYLGTPPRR